MSATIIPLKDKHPIIHESAFIACGAVIIGDVEIGPGASIWYNCVVRADVNCIRIGARSNIQDGSIIHCSGPSADMPTGMPTLIGEDVLIGHAAVVHGCTLNDRAFVGMGSIVLDGCSIESDGMLAAGAILTGRKTISSREVWQGRPAKFSRLLSKKEIVSIGIGVNRYCLNAQSHKSAIPDTYEDAPAFHPGRG